MRVSKQLDSSSVLDIIDHEKINKRVEEHPEIRETKDRQSEQEEEVERGIEEGKEVEDEEIGHESVSRGSIHDRQICSGWYHKKECSGAGKGAVAEAYQYAEIAPTR